MRLFVGLLLRIEDHLSHVLRHIDLANPHFFFNDPATTEIYTLSLHDALPISAAEPPVRAPTPPPRRRRRWFCPRLSLLLCRAAGSRSEEHTSELQSRRDL